MAIQAKTAQGNAIRTAKARADAAVAQKPVTATDQLMFIPGAQWTDSMMPNAAKLWVNSTVTDLPSAKQALMIAFAEIAALKALIDHLSEQVKELT